MKKMKKKFFEVHLLNGRGLASSDALSSVATILNRIDYNIKSMGVL